MIQNSILPESMEEDTIRNMSVGDRAYTVPWAMWADPERRLWINPDYNITPEPRGTSHMLIEKRDGLVIVFRHTLEADDKFSPRESDWQHKAVAVQFSDEIPQRANSQRNRKA